MSDKQLLAALEITNDEVRLLVGEFYNTRLNVLKLERVEVHAMNGVSIKNPMEIEKAISKAIAKASELIGAKVEKVLLCIPSCRMNKDTHKVSKMIDNYDHQVSEDDLHTIIKKGYELPINEDLALVNLVCNRFITNGIVSRKIPLGENCDVLDVEMDLLCADKVTTYDYVSVVEKSGTRVLDIFLDCYAGAKEASLFTKSIKNTIIFMQLEQERTVLSVLVNGKLEIAKIINRGFLEWIVVLSNSFGIRPAAAKKIILQNLDLGVSDPDDSPIYIWKKDDQTFTLSMKQVYEVLLPNMEKWILDVKDICEPIMARDNVQMVIANQGAEIDGLSTYMSNLFGIETSRYLPDTIGARNGSWTNCLGMIYAYVDQQQFYRQKSYSINQTQFNNSIKVQKNEEPDDMFTKKFKDLLFQNKEKKRGHK